MVHLTLFSSAEICGQILTLYVRADRYKVKIILQSFVKIRLFEGVDLPPSPAGRLLLAPLLLPRGHRLLARGSELCRSS